MKISILSYAGLVIGMVFICGCAPFFSGSSEYALRINSGRQYSGSKAKAAVADFGVQAANVNTQVAQDLRNLLVGSLLSSNRFFIADQHEPEKSDLLVSVVVTEFHPQASGGSGGIGGGGGAGSGALGGLLAASSNKAQITMNLRILDASGSSVLAAKSLQGQAADATISTEFSNNQSLGEFLSFYARTPMEKAIRLCIFEATRYIVQETPESYYKY